MSILEERFTELIDILPKFKHLSESRLELAATVIAETFLSGSKVLICGNGGSAADSQHLAAEFVGSFSKDIKRDGLPAIALTTDSSILTAISNDFAFEDIFSRQIEAYGAEGDSLIVFTTSGNSQNCLKAVRAAKGKNIRTIAFTKINAEITKLVDIAIEVPSSNTQHIQECHILSYHILSELVESELQKI